jgi:hypothetical protein
LLEALCGLTVSQQLTLRSLQRLERGGDDFDRDDWVVLLNQLGTLSGRIATLATKMRLTPQSRYGARGAATAGQLLPDGPKPWDRDGWKK